MFDCCSYSQTHAKCRSTWYNTGMLCVCMFLNPFFSSSSYALCIFSFCSSYAANRQEKCCVEPLGVFACFPHNKEEKNSRSSRPTNQTWRLTFYSWPSQLRLLTNKNTKEKVGPHSSHSNNSRLGNGIEIQLSFWSLRINREWTVMLSLVCLYWLGLKGGQPMMVFNWVDEEGGSKKGFFLFGRGVWHLGWRIGLAIKSSWKGRRGTSRTSLCWWKKNGNPDFQSNSFSHFL